MDTSRAPHIVILPFPAQGHVNGAMDMARKLASFDIYVTVACTEAYITNINQHNLHGTACERGSVRLVTITNVLPPEKRMTDSLHKLSDQIEATELMAPLFEDLLKKLNKEGRIACVLYDFMLWWIGRLCKKLGITTYIFYAMSASFFSYLSYIPELVCQGRLPLGSKTDLSDESNVFNVPGLPSLHVSELPDISWSPNALCSFEYTLRSTAAWRDAAGILFNTVYELEKEVIEALKKRAPEMDIKAVGPILPPEFLTDEVQRTEGCCTTSEGRCLEWLDVQPTASVLYVAFGTVGSPSREQVRELAAGIEESGERFMWVTRGAMGEDEAAGAEAAERVMQDGGLGELPEGFEGRTRGRGLVVRGVAPQRQILAHRAVGGFLTHCGWNSTLEAMCRGVPLLCLPLFGDQGMNAKWMEEVVEAGRRLGLPAAGAGRPQVVERGEVRRQVQQIMQPLSPLRLSASRARELAMRAARPGGSSYAHLCVFVQALQPP